MIPLFLLYLVRYAGKLVTKRNIARMRENWVFSLQMFSSALQYLQKSVQFFVHNVLMVCSQELVNISLFPQYLMNAILGAAWAVAVAMQR
jgi:hypothetical protein